MDIARVNALWDQYTRAAPTLDRTVSPSDDMFQKSGGWDDYLRVGASSIDVILQALMLAKLQEIRTVLDFGCGHGRTARHLPLLSRPGRHAVHRRRLPSGQAHGAGGEATSDRTLSSVGQIT